MSNRDRQRIIALQKQIKIAKEALQKIHCGCRDSMGVAGSALYEMDQIEYSSRPTPAHVTARSKPA